MFRVVNLQNLNSKYRTNQNKFPNVPIQQNPVFPFPNKFTKPPTSLDTNKIHNIHNNVIKIKTNKPKRVLQSSQTKRSFSVKNLFDNNNQFFQNSSENEYFFHNFKKKPSLFDQKPKKNELFEEESVNISVYFNIFK